MDLLFDNCSVFCELIWTLAEDDYSFSEFHPGKQSFQLESLIARLKPTVKLKSVVPVHFVVSCCICVTINCSFAWEIGLFSPSHRPAASSDILDFQSPANISFCWLVVSANIDSAKADKQRPGRSSKSPQMIFWHRLESLLVLCGVISRNGNWQWKFEFVKTFNRLDNVESRKHSVMFEQQWSGFNSISTVLIP